MNRGIPQDIKGSSVRCLGMEKIIIFLTEKGKGSVVHIGKEKTGQVTYMKVESYYTCWRVRDNKMCNVTKLKGLGIAMPIKMV